MINGDIAKALRELAAENWHVHTTYSTCAESDMTLWNILQEADRLGLRALALVDHHHPGDPDPLVVVESLKSELARLECKARVTIGIEFSAFGVGRYAATAAVERLCGYRLQAVNHYHVPAWEHPRVRSPRAYQEHMQAILRGLIASGRADCIAHPFLGCYLARYVADVREVTRSCSDDELVEMFVLARARGVAWEISTRHLVNDPAFARRFLRIGFNCGADFRLGTDAHRLCELDPRTAVEELIAALKN